MPRRATNRTRWLRLPAVTCLLLGVIAGLFVTSASAASLPPEGIFEDCPLDTQMPTCVQRLQTIHQGGFQIVVMSAKSGSLSSLQAYAASAQSLGMSVMWELGDSQWWQDPPTSTSASSYYGDFAAACGCNQNGPLLAYVVQWLAQLPATYGYYAADDSALVPGDAANVANYVAQIKQQDPVHTVMIGSAEESQTATYQPIADVIGSEIYPVTTDPLMPVSANQDEWNSVGQWAADAQHSANRAGKQSAFILQAFTWGDNLSDGQAIGACSPTDTQLSCYAKLRYPSSDEQLQLRNEILMNSSPKLILWWSFSGTYGAVGGNGYSIYPTGAEAATRWAGLSAAVGAPFPGPSPAASAASPTTPRLVGAHLARAVSITRTHAVRGADRRRHHRHHKHRHKRR
jgi:hypothetical protein